MNTLGAWRGDSLGRNLELPASTVRRGANTSAPIQLLQRAKGIAPKTASSLLAEPSCEIQLPLRQKFVGPKEMAFRCFIAHTLAVVANTPEWKAKI
jgi:hypothetical protein